MNTRLAWTIVAVVGAVQHPAARPRAPVPSWPYPASPPSVATPANQSSCVWCHLANGAGRPESAALAGLPVPYILAQIAAFHAGTRRSAQPAYVPAASMIVVATSVTDSDAQKAARYFSGLVYRSHVRVVESSRVPHTDGRNGGYVPLPRGGTEPLGMRIIEIPTDTVKDLRHDEAAEYVAYVPPGSIARGRALAGHARGGIPSCVSCHGATLEGKDVAPPLAGRQPMYLVRQLLAFQAGTRQGTVQPMNQVAAHLSVSDMVALAAYAASLRP